MKVSQMNKQKRGKVVLFMGPMFAGKTTALMNEINKCEEEKRSLIIFKFDRDTRFSNTDISTHNGMQHPAVSTATLMEHLQKSLEYDSIFIDEGQFFSDIVEFVNELYDNKKNVFISCLDGSFQRKQFSESLSVLKLIQIAEPFQKMHALDKFTNQSASFSMRTIESKELIVIGSEEMYQPVSRSTFFDQPISGDIHLFLDDSSNKRKEFLSQYINNTLPSDRKVFHINSTQEEQTLPSTLELDEYDTITVDNVERYENIAEWADKLANSGKHVVLTARVSNSNKEMYPHILNLIPLCEFVEKQN